MSDSSVFGISKMKKLWPNSSAIAFRYKSPCGSRVEGSTDLPDELAEEIVGKIVAHMGGEDWRQWKPTRDSK